MSIELVKQRLSKRERWFRTGETNLASNGKRGVCDHTGLAHSVQVLHSVRKIRGEKRR
jgi:hypothetical protein